MANSDNQDSPAHADPTPEPVLGYFVAAPARSVRDDLALSEIVHRCWRGRWIIIATSFVMAGLFVVWATYSQKTYRATAVLSVVRPDGSGDAGLGLGGQLGVLAAAAGLRSGTSNANREEFIAFLKSRRLQAAFIESEGLLPALYADRWDPVAKKWKSGDPSAIPSMDEAVEKLRRTFLKVDIDKVTGLISVSFESTNRRSVARWVQGYVDLANRAIRARTTAESDRSLKFLNRELQDTQPVAVQQAIYGLMQNQLNSKMLASVREEYAYRTIDNATEPSVRRHVRPIRRAYAVVGAFLGFIIAALFSVRHFRTRPA